MGYFELSFVRCVICIVLYPLFVKVFALAVGLKFQHYISVIFVDELSPAFLIYFLVLPFVGFRGLNQVFHITGVPVFGLGERENRQRN
ncbi:hypothetical protein BDK61_0805 [Haloarcula quadrata]|uniref:Uncharacterized protein n=1 Tax=Haloarcula quadrata TaxID=182779 RepID=A0A495R2R8_9EURY|nr:hypothetical protein BDK61_0805 [Haloarcula quadrata]